MTETIEFGVGDNKFISFIRERGKTTVVLSSGDYSAEEVERVNSAIARLIDISHSIHIRGDGGVVKLCAPIQLPWVGP